MFSDPRLVNYVILALQVLCAVRWAAARSWPDVWYWTSAVSITAAMTWGYQR